MLAKYPIIMELAFLNEKEIGLKELKTIAVIYYKVELFYFFVFNNKNRLNAREFSRMSLKSELIDWLD